MVFLELPLPHTTPEHATHHSRTHHTPHHTRTHQNAPHATHQKRYKTRKVLVQTMGKKKQRGRKGASPQSPSMPAIDESSPATRSSSSTTPPPAAPAPRTGETLPSAAEVAHQLDVVCEVARQRREGMAQLLQRTDTSGSLYEVTSECSRRFRVDGDNVWVLLQATEIDKIWEYMRVNHCDFPRGHVRYDPLDFGYWQFVGVHREEGAATSSGDHPPA